MRKWTWVLLFGVLALLFLWTAREGFQSTATLKGPPYGDSDYPAIVNMMPATLVKDIETASGITKPILPPNATAADTSKYQHDLLAYQRKIVDSRITGVLSDFYNSVYQPASAPISQTNVDTFLASRDVSGLRKNDVNALLVAYFVTQPHGDVNASLTSAQTQSANVASSSGYDAVLAGLGQGSTSGSTVPTPKCAASGVSIIDGQCKKPNVPSTPATCPLGTTLGLGGTKCYGPDSMTPAQATAAGLTYNSITYRYSKDVSPTCPAGYTIEFDTCVDTNATDPVCSSGYKYYRPQARCEPANSPLFTGGPPGGGPPGGGPPGGGPPGGSSMFVASNSGKNKGNIWGPAYTGMGDNAGNGSGNGSRDYPTLLGPQPNESTMVEGAGIAKPSQHQTLVTSGVLPGASQTGSDPDSQYFGSSRVPGDKDLFPNPYQEFTPSIGSSKTEPVPFLSDFSAFFH